MKQDVEMIGKTTVHEIPFKNIRLATKKNLDLCVKLTDTKSRCVRL